MVSFRFGLLAVSIITPASRTSNNTARRSQRHSGVSSSPRRCGVLFGRPQKVERGAVALTRCFGSDRGPALVVQTQRLPARGWYQRAQVLHRSTERGKTKTALFDLLPPRLINYWKQHRKAMPMRAETLTRDAETADACKLPSPASYQGTSRPSLLVPFFCRFASLRMARAMTRYWSERSLSESSMLRTVSANLVCRVAVLNERGTRTSPRASQCCATIHAT